MGAFPEPVVFEVEAEDGVILRGHRYPRPGARAVVCGHGLASTNYEFDLPLAGFNLAEKLHAMGYEVWTVNWRGAGHAPANSGARDWHHSGDWAGAVDLPAIMAAVEATASAAETGGAGGAGKRPFYMGHSFGGMSLYIYLQGTFVDRRDSFKVKRDPDLARERNARLAGVVTVGSPISMHGYGVDLIEKVRRSWAAQAWFQKIEGWLVRRDRVAPRFPLDELALGFGLEHPRVAQLIMTAPFARFYLQPRNMGREACGVFGTWAGGSVSARHLAHMVQFARLGDFAPFAEDGGQPRFTYTDGIPFITTPLVMVGGSADTIREDRLRAGVFDRVSSEHKRFIFLKSAGHVDQLYLMDLADIFGWLEEHAGEG